MFNEWLELVKRVVDKTQDNKASSICCPNCESNSIDYQYVGDVATKVGYLDIWCKTCLNGIHISRIKVPENVDMLSFDTSPERIAERIPDFIQITPLDKPE